MNRRRQNGVGRNEKLRILMLEDSASDARLVEHELRKGSFNFVLKRVETEKSFVQQLNRFSPDLILADFSLPSFDGASALEIALREYPRVPFIFVSGAIGEEGAIDLLKKGATDYVLKDRLERLPSAVSRALREVEEKRERKRAEEALRESEELLKFATDAAELGAWDLDLTTGAVWRSLRHDQIFGYSSLLPEWTYAMLLEHVVPEDRPEVNSRFREAVEKGREWRVECRIRRSDGATRWIWVDGRVRFDGDKPVRIQGIVRDITEQRVIEAQLRNAQKMEALGTLTGGIAHDFNNILAAMIGFTELTLDRIPKGSREERHLRRVLEAGLRGRELIKQMLVFSRKCEQEKKPLRLSSAIKETMRLLRASIPSTINIRTKVESESGLILGDPIQIQQVLMNLFNNAAYAVREKGGTLDVELSDFSVSANGRSGVTKPGLYMKLVVRDTGVGIPPEIIDRIFDPFFTTKKPEEGTGLGLSVVHGIVQEHDGYITVESEPGKGSTFTLYFPKVAEKPRRETASDEAIPTGHERVLFIDDEEALTDMGRELLEDLGYKVRARNSSVEALALFRADPNGFDVIITDQTMPGMTGVELAKEVTALRPDIPIILTTGFSHLVDAKASNAAGIRAFVMKPLTRGELARTVRKVLDE